MLTHLVIELTIKIGPDFVDKIRLPTAAHIACRAIILAQKHLDNFDGVFGDVGCDTTTKLASGGFGVGSGQC